MCSDFQAYLPHREQRAHFAGAPQVSREAQGVLVPKASLPQRLGGSHCWTAFCSDSSLSSSQSPSLALLLRTRIWTPLGLLPTARQASLSDGTALPRKVETAGAGALVTLIDSEKLPPKASLSCPEMGKQIRKPSSRMQPHWE